MKFEIIQGIIIPFIGTALGASCVFALKGNIGLKLKSILSGFAGGVMLAASVWSLIIPAIEGSESLGMMKFFPATIGFLLGIISLIALDKAIPSRA